MTKDPKVAVGDREERFRQLLRDNPDSASQLYDAIFEMSDDRWEWLEAVRVLLGRAKEDAELSAALFEAMGLEVFPYVIEHNGRDWTLVRPQEKPTP